MALRHKILKVCECFLRVPPLLVIDEILRLSFGWNGGIIFSAKQLDNSSDINLKSESSSNLSDYFSPFNNNPLNSSSSAPNLSSSSHLNDVEDSETFSSPPPNVSNVFYILQESSSKSASENVIEKVVESVSVPSKIIEDYLFKFDFGDISQVQSEVTGDLIRLFEILLCVTVFVSALIMFLMRTDKLIKLYSYIVSFFMLYLAYVIKPIPLFWGTEFIWPFVASIFLRTFFAGIYFIFRSWPGESSDLENSAIASTFDALVFSLFYLTGVVHMQPLVFAFFAAFFQISIWICIPKIYNFLKTSWNETKRVQNEYGLSHLINVETGRLKANTVFRLFWITRAIYDGFIRCCDEPVGYVFRYVLSHGTETFTGIVGLTMTISSICHQIGEFILLVLYYGGNTEADANRFGSISTVLFFILSLQTGLTSMSPEKRLDRLFKNVVLLGTALFHAIHQMVVPFLHAFRTFQALQIRALSISFTFLIISLISSWCIVRQSVISTWSLAVLALAIEFKIKIVISLIISMVVYLSQLVQYPDLFLKIGNFFRRILPKFIIRFFDNLYDQISMEDMVFYLKTIANVAEFLTGIFLFVNAIWIFLFESASAIRAIGMSIHAYFNIWCEAKKGWRIYGQRKTASLKIEGLSDATNEQLAERDDVCAICYEEMESAKVTHCGHLFHAVCLRKWLYVQNTCPLCHLILYEENFPSGEEDGEAVIVGGGAPNPLEERGIIEVVDPLENLEQEFGGIMNENVIQIAGTSEHNNNRLEESLHENRQSSILNEGSSSTLPQSLPSLIARRSSRLQENSNEERG